MTEAPRHFTVMFTGQLEFADIPDCSNAYCKYLLVHGDDWSVLDGLEDGITQITRKCSGPNPRLVWNFPLDITYKSTNAFGWPQLVLSVFEVDGLGRDIIKGYGCIHLPITPGSHTRKIPLYKPLSASLFQQFTSFITGMPAEFSDAKFPSFGHGREVTRVKSAGFAVVQLHAMTKDMAMFGYTEDAGPSKVGTSVDM